MNIRYGSVCSGIEAATAAWHTLKWNPAFFSEIEDFPRAVLSHHYPDVPCHGDFTTIGKDEYGTIDLLVGGTPCQSFSIAGLRKGLADDRGNLALEFIRLAERKRPRWVVWENVPGALSIDRGRAFGSILGGLAQCGYGFAYRVLDAQYFGVPQRRKRVFVVGCLGSWQRAAAVLFERESLCGDLTPRREKGEGPAAFTPGSIGGYSVGCGTLRANGGDLGGGSETLIIPETMTFDRQSSGEYGTSPVASTMSARDYKGASDLICHIDGGETARTLTARHDGSPDSDRGPNVIAYRTAGDGAVYEEGNKTAPLTTQTDPSANVLAVALRGRDGGSTAELMGECAGALRASQGGGDKAHVLTKMQVRRLTPRECERLQGFPDDYTLIPYRGGVRRRRATLQGDWQQHGRARDAMDRKAY